MTNIFNADVYRLRKGAALRNTLIAVVGTVLLILIMSTVAESTDAAPAAMEAEDVVEIGIQIEESFATSADFVYEMLGQSVNMFLCLPIMLAVFSCDFTNGTYRNTLSFETNRYKVYFSKLLLNIVISFILSILNVLSSIIFSGILYGFDSFTAAIILEYIWGIFLQMPVYIGVICLGQCAIAFIRKSSGVIAVYIVGLMIVGIAVQTLMISFPNAQWFMYIDPLTAITALAGYRELTLKEILTFIGVFSGVGVISSLIGAKHFKTADMV